MADFLSLVLASMLVIFKLPASPGSGPKGDIPPAVSPHMLQTPLESHRRPHIPGGGEDAPHPICHEEAGQTISMSNRVKEHLVIGGILPQAPPPGKQAATHPVTDNQKTVAVNIRSIHLHYWVRPPVGDNVRLERPASGCLAPQRVGGHTGGLLAPGAQKPGKKEGQPG